MMRNEEIKVGQVVKHKDGFIAVIEKIDGIHLQNVHMKVIEVGTSSYRRKGDAYIGLAEYLTLLVDVKQPVTNKMSVDVEVTGLEKLEELVALENEQTIFTVSMGNGIEFEGTKSDYKVFMEELKGFLQFDKDLNKYKF